MDPRAFLVLAQGLSKKSSGEAALRTSVSRSYYALLNFFVQFMEHNGFRLPKAGQKHKIVYRCLFNCGIPRIPPIAKELDELLEARNEADYDLESGDLCHYQKQACFSRIKAKDAYDNFANFVGDNSNRKRLVEEMKHYGKKCPF